jgi:hypothetical protein
MISLEGKQIMEEGIWISIKNWLKIIPLEMDNNEDCVSYWNSRKVTAKYTKISRIPGRFCAKNNTFVTFGTKSIQNTAYFSVFCRYYFMVFQ